MRQTSIIAYNQIKDEGLLSKMRFRAYELIYEFGPMTAFEMEEKEKTFSQNIRAYKHLHKRLSELRDFGVIVEVRERPCTMSGRMAIEWDVTQNIPKILDKKKTKDQIIKELRIEIEDLKKQLKQQLSFNL